MNIEWLSQSFEKWDHPISRMMSRIASVILFLMMLLTIADVFLRKVFSKSILGTVELTEFMLAILIFFSLAQTEIMNGHVKVDLVVGRFSERAQGFVDMITQFICFILSGLITWSTLIYSGKMRAVGEVSQDLWIPIYPFIYVVAAGCAILSFTLLIKFFMALIRVARA